MAPETSFDVMIGAILFDNDPSAVTALVHFVVKNLGCGNCSALFLNQLCMEEPASIAQRSKTVGTTSPLRCLGGATPLTLMHRLRGNLHHRHERRHLLCTREQWSLRRHAQWTHGQMVHEIILVLMLTMC